MLLVGDSGNDLPNRCCHNSPGNIASIGASFSQDDDSSLGDRARDGFNRHARNDRGRMV
jgi:hypothetical protein